MTDGHRAKRGTRTQNTCSSVINITCLACPVIPGSQSSSREVIVTMVRVIIGNHLLSSAPRRTYELGTIYVCTLGVSAPSQADHKVNISCSNHCPAPRPPPSSIIIHTVKILGFTQTKLHKDFSKPLNIIFTYIWDPIFSIKTFVQFV